MGLFPSTQQHRKIATKSGAKTTNKSTNKPVNKTKIVAKPVNKSTDTKQVSSKKREQIPSHIRNTIWEKYHGNSNEGICYSCGIIIQRYNAGWHCSHVISDNKGGQITIENLRTCCKHCNLSMGNCNLYVYIKDKGLKGPGSNNVETYLRKNKSQVNDKRTNNWGK